MRISGHERQRYDCQLVLKEVGERGQDALRHGSVLVVGAGGLGSPILYYLAAAGVGRIGIVDDDVVDLSNLQRQILFTTADIGRPKVEVAVERLAALNPEVTLEPHASRLMAATAAGVIGGYDVVVTAVDNFPTRYLINDACVLAGKTLVDGAVLRMTGLAMTIKGGRRPATAASSRSLRRRPGSSAARRPGCSARSPASSAPSRRSRSSRCSPAPGGRSTIACCSTTAGR